MIITVTMNPAIDKTIEINQLVQGGLNRIQHVEIDAGGKGINVSKTICALGGETIATGFNGGHSGRIIEEALKQRGIQSDFVDVHQETRTNTKVHEKDGPITELNEQGFCVSEAHKQSLLDKIKKYANPQALFILAGSIPKGISPSIYAEIIAIIKENNGKVIVDADGELFTESLQARPHVIKPNREELAEYAGIKGEVSQDELVTTAQEFLNNGVELVVISMGKDGALFLSNEFQYHCEGLKVKVHSTVGAGDAMVSALAYAMHQGYDFDEMVCLAMATSAGAVTTLGTKPPTKEVVETLKKQVKIRKIGE
ncbi:MAG: 1-phosphofructokinase [Erysipelotrichaceae bacterium]